MQGLHLLKISGRSFLIRRGGDIAILRHSRVGSGLSIVPPTPIKRKSSCPMATLYEPTQ